MGSDGGAITFSHIQTDANPEGLGGLPHRQGTLPTAGQTTSPLTLETQHRGSLTLLESSIPIDIEKHGFRSCICGPPVSVS